MEHLVLATALSTGAKITSGISSALSGLKSARELAKNSSDTALKDQLSDIYNDVLELRESLHDLQTENESLRKQLTEKAKIKRDAQHGYYFIEEETDPLCRVCYEKNALLIHLDKAFTDSTGHRSRWCCVCLQNYDEN